jgi:ABC-type protease/lipase transport system fused ATPase/permease subunit
VRVKIRLDSAAYDQWDSCALGRHIGYVPQDIELLEGTIAQNISRFAEQPDPNSIIETARAARVHELITALPQGYDTLIGENGIGLSAGQAQRVALARALYGNPFLVVLDEPNSNLDAEGDEALFDAILAIRARKAIAIVVAHRPSAIAGLDLVLVLNGGRQIEFGPKEATLAKILKKHVPPAALKVVPDTGTMSA